MRMSWLWFIGEKDKYYEQQKAPQAQYPAGYTTPEMRERRLKGELPFTN